MFTEREKEILGKYLTWYIAMRSPRLEEEQEEVRRIIDGIRDEKLNGRTPYDFKIFTYQNQNFIFHFASGNIYKADQLTADVVNAYNVDKDNVLESLKDKYGRDDIDRALKSIYGVIAAGA